MCRIFACRNGAGEEMPSLWSGLAYGCPSLARKERAVVAFTGSGGKTTWIYRLSEELRRQGKRVAVATTTHMYEPPSELLADDTETVKSLLEGQGFAVVGRRDAAEVLRSARAGHPAGCRLHRPCGGIIRPGPSSGRGLFPLGTKSMESAAGRYRGDLHRRRPFRLSVFALELDGAGHTCFQSSR